MSTLHGNEAKHSRSFGPVICVSFRRAGARRALKSLLVFVVLFLCLALLGAGGALAKEKAKTTKKPAGQTAASAPKVPKTSRKMDPHEAMGIVLSSEGSPIQTKDKVPITTGRKDKPNESATVGGGGARSDKVATKKNTKSKRISSRNVKKPVTKKGAKAEGRAATAITQKTSERVSPQIESGQKFIKAKKWDKAVASFDKVLAKDASNEEALEGKIYALEKIGNDEALEKLDDIADVRPNMPSVHAARARLLEKQGDTVEALGAWEKALSQNPKSTDYRLGLAILNDQLGRRAEAIQYYRSVPNLPLDARKRLDYLLKTTSPVAAE